MARPALKSDDLATLSARRAALLAELGKVEEQAKAAEETARDAGRPVFLAALERVKIAAMEKADARTIAAAIARHGGKSVAEHVASLSNA